MNPDVSITSPLLRIKLIHKEKNNIKMQNQVNDYTHKTPDRTHIHLHTKITVAVKAIAVIMWWEVRKFAIDYGNSILELMDYITGNP